MGISNKFKIIKYACYSAYVVTACVFSLPAILFVTFREMYGVSGHACDCCFPDTGIYSVGIYKEEK